MVSTVTLTIANGEQEGREYAFDQPFVGYIGRARDCEIILPDEPEYHLVSRHHCLLDIDPPEIGVSDGSSLNGTFVNGVRIGGGRKHDRVETPLAEGDELRVGRTVFRVAVETSARCVECGAILGTSEIEFTEGETEDRRCAACQRKLAETAELREVCST
jgi:eukaryotic-like serine/threonine-protein kinase